MKKEQLYSKRKVNYEEIMNRKMKELYVVIHMITVELYIGEGTLLEKNKLNIMYGLDIHGRKDLIGIYVENKSNNRYWIDEVEKLKNRGIKKVIYFTSEGNKRLEQAFKIVYNSEVRISINAEVEKIAKYTQYRWKSTGEQELVHLYLSENIEKYEEQLKMLKEKYKENKIGITLIEEFDKKVKRKVMTEAVELRHLICSYSSKRKFKEQMIRAEKKYEKIKDIDDLIEKEREYFVKFESTRSYSKEKWTKLLNKLYQEKYEEIEEYI